MARYANKAIPIFSKVVSIATALLRFNAVELNEFVASLESYFFRSSRNLVAATKTPYKLDARASVSLNIRKCTCLRRELVFQLFFS